MNGWQQGFAKRVEGLRESAVRRFERFADEAVEGVYEEFSAFTTQHEFRTSEPPRQRGTRVYKFALSEDAYVLIYFRAKGLDAAESDYDYSVPGRGCAHGEKTSQLVAEANRQWVERCFQAALDDLVGKLSDTGAAEKTAQLVGV